MKVGFINLVNPESEPTVLEFEEGEQDETTYADVLELQEIKFDPEKHQLFF